MKSPVLNLQIGRLVVDAPFAEGVTVDALADAIRSELGCRMWVGPAEPSRATPHPRTAAPLARMIAVGIASKLGAMNTGIGLKPRGGCDGAL
jgi:hypothetical protein